MHAISAHTCPRSGKGGSGGGGGGDRSCPDGKGWRYETCLGGKPWLCDLTTPFYITLLVAFKLHVH